MRQRAAERPFLGWRRCRRRRRCGVYHRRSARAARPVGRHLAGVQGGGVLQHQRALDLRRRAPGRHRGGRRVHGLRRGAHGVGERIAGLVAGRIRRARWRQRLLHRPPHRLVHLARIAEAHLDLGRVHVHVDPVRCDVDAQHIARLPRTMQHVLVGRAHAMPDQPVAHMAAVDVGVLQICPRPRRLGQPDPAADQQRPHLHLDRPARSDEIRPQHVAHTLFGCGGAQLLDQLALVPDRESDVRMHQRVAPHGFEAVAQLGRVGLEELAPRRGGEEQLAHLDRGAGGAGRRGHLAGAGVDAPGVCALGGAAGDRQLGHRADGGQRLAAKAHGGDLLQVAERADLAGGVAAQGQRQLVLGDARAVVLDHDGAHAARAQAHGDLRGAGVQRVVQQFAHDRGGTLDHLAGRDLADQLVGQFTDGAARGREDRHGADCRNPARARGSAVKGRLSAGSGRSRSIAPARRSASRSAPGG